MQPKDQGMIRASAAPSTGRAWERESSAWRDVQGWEIQILRHSKYVLDLPKNQARFFTKLISLASPGNLEMRMQSRTKREESKREGGREGVDFECSKDAG